MACGRRAYITGHVPRMAPWAHRQYIMKLSTISNSTTGKLLITVAGSTVLYLLSSFLLPILLSVGLAFLLYPVTLLARRIPVGPGKYHPTRVMAILLAFVFFGVFLFALVQVLVLPLFEQFNALASQLPKITGGLHSTGELENLITKTKSSLPELPSNLDSLVDDAIRWAMGILADVGNHLMESTLSILSNLFGLVVVPFLAFYFLKDWRVLKAMCLDLFTPRQRVKVNQVLNHIGKALSSYTMGLGKMCLISGTVVTLALMGMGVRYSLVFGFVAFLAEAIPVVGPVIAAVPPIFMAYTRDPNLALMVLVFYLVYYTIDSQAIMPYVMGRDIGLHPVVIIVALMIGARLFGAVGMLFAVPVAAVYKVLYDELWHYQGKEPLPNERQRRAFGDAVKERGYWELNVDEAQEQARRAQGRSGDFKGPNGPD